MSKVICSSSPFMATVLKCFNPNYDAVSMHTLKEMLPEELFVPERDKRKEKNAINAALAVWQPFTKWEKDDDDSYVGYSSEEEENFNPNGYEEDQFKKFCKSLPKCTEKSNS